MVRPTFIGLAAVASLAACASFDDDLPRDCESCDWPVSTEPIDRVSGPVAGHCSLYQGAVLCALVPDVHPGITVERIFLEVDGTPLGGAELSAERPEVRLWPPGDGARITATIELDAEATTALGASGLPPLQTTLELTGDAPNALIRGPGEIWRMEVLGFASGQLQLSEDDSVSSGRPLGTVDLEAGHRRILNLITSSPEAGLIWRDRGSDRLGRIAAPAVFALTEQGLHVADDSHTPRAAPGSPAVHCRHENNRLLCAMDARHRDALGKVQIQVHGADGSHFELALSQRFPDSVRIPDSALPVRLSADIPVSDHVLGLPPEHRTFRTTATIARGFSAELVLPVRFVDLRLAADPASVTSVIFDPITQDFGRTLDGWFRYRHPEASITLSSVAVELDRTIVAVPPASEGAWVRIKTMGDTSEAVPAVIDSGSWLLDRRGATPLDDPPPV